MTQDQIIDFCLYPHDGPVTQFVVMYRLGLLASDGSINAQAMADAADEMMSTEYWAEMERA